MMERKGLLITAKPIYRDSQTRRLSALGEPGIF
jgi:hypothetical protein